MTIKNLKTLTLSIAIGLTLAAGVTYAAWATNVWNPTDEWIQDGAVISAQKVAENFEYLLKISGDLCTTDNQNAVRFTGGVIEYCNGTAWVSTITYAWSTGVWGECATDGSGGYEKMRNIICNDENGSLAADSFCTATKPANAQACATVVYNAPTGGFKECGGVGGSGNVQKSGGTLLCAGKKAGNSRELNTAHVMCENKGHSFAVDQALTDYGSNQYAWWDSYTHLTDVWGIDYSCSGCRSEHISQITCVE